MPQCECLPKCVFFHDKMAHMPGMSAMLKTRYCQGESRACARHRVFRVVGPGNVPDDLFPHEAHKVESVLASLNTAP